MPAFYCRYVDKTLQIKRQAAKKSHPKVAFDSKPRVNPVK
jgi:hypothetical protein